MRYAGQRNLPDADSLFALSMGQDSLRAEKINPTSRQSKRYPLHCRVHCPEDAPDCNRKIIGH